MSGFNGEKKDDDDDEVAGGGFVHPFKGVDKAHVIQEARIFNDPNVEAHKSSPLPVLILTQTCPQTPTVQPATRSSGILSDPPIRSARQAGPSGPPAASPTRRHPLLFVFTLVTGPRRSLSLKLSDTRVYEPQIRARLGTTLSAQHTTQSRTPHPPRAMLLPSREGPHGI